MSALDRLNEETVRRNNELINQENNSFNFGKTQQQQSVTPLEDSLLAAVDRNRARKNAEMLTPLYKEQQSKSNAQALAQAIQGTKQVESMSYGGNPVKQSPDGKYWLENGQEVTDTANIQTNNKFDPIAGALQATQDTGNTLAVQTLLDQMKPKQGIDMADKLALQQQDFLFKKELADAKPKKDTDLKPSDINQFLTALGVGDYNDNDKAVLTSAAYEASDNPKKLDALSNALTSNSMHNYTPFMAKRWLSQDSFAKAMQAFQNK